MASSSFSPDFVLECARTIRFYLPDLLGPDAAQQMDTQLADLLAQAKAGQSVDGLLLDLLKSTPATRSWAAEFLSPPPVAKGPGDAQLPGRISAINAPCYICLEGDYVWYRRSAGVPLPVCPTHPHLGPLVPADAHAL